MSNQYPQPIQNWQPPQQPHQPQQPYPFQTAPVFQPLPPKKSKRGLAVAVIVGILVLVGLAGMVNSPGFKKGFSEGYASAKASSVAVPAKADPTTAAPTVTVTAPAPATAVVATNVALLQVVWGQASAADKETIRSTWRAAKGDTARENAMLDMTLSSFTSFVPTLTRAEARVWLDWTLTH